MRELLDQYSHTKKPIFANSQFITEFNFSRVTIFVCEAAAFF